MSSCPALWTTAHDVDISSSDRIKVERIST
jgi:hypothetical protein